MANLSRFLREHRELTRRYFLSLGAAASASGALWPLAAGAEPPAELEEAIRGLEPYFTPQERFRDVSRGKPLPHSLSDEQKRAAGITRETCGLLI